MTTQMIVRVDRDTKAKLSRLARMEGKSTSEVLRNLIDAYIRDRDPEAYIEDLWARVSRTLESKGVGLGDVERAISEIRRSRR